MNQKPIIKVSANVFLIKDNKILLGKRKNTAGAGTWGLPGGHVEFGESLMSAAKREIKEETGIIISKLDFLHVINDPLVEIENTHYIHFNFFAKDWQGEPQLLEPDKCSEWKWFNLNHLPKNIFIGHRRFIPAYLQKLNFIDAQYLDKDYNAKNIVTIKPYSKKFIKMFQQYRSEIQKATKVKDIQHIGSTAIPGLGGKGIIDILIGVNSWQEADMIVPKLQELGFRYFKPKMRGRISLTNASVTKYGDAHIHIVLQLSKQYQDFIKFRDLLRSDQKLADDYFQHKRLFVNQAKNDRKMYRELKDKYIHKVVGENS